MKNVLKAMDSVRKFDLNIGQILEHWDLRYAVREIIANALDEQKVTQTKDIEIYNDSENCWHIRDFGRGLHYRHLIEDENIEKLNRDDLIGKFGIGLKDALAVFYRFGVGVKITSKYGIYTLTKMSKSGFDDVITLQVQIAPPIDKDMIGTDVFLYGIDERDIRNAKKLFLKFSQERILEKTKYGDVIAADDSTSLIYLNGMVISMEYDFLFSYNITHPTKQLRRALNRERDNIGRAAYSPAIKSILSNCQSNETISSLIGQFYNIHTGNYAGELYWKEIQLFVASKIQERNSNVIFVNQDDLLENATQIKDMQATGSNIVVIPQSLSKEMDKKDESGEGEFNTFTQYQIENFAMFNPQIIDVNNLTKSEKNVFNKTDELLHFIGGKPIKVHNIYIVTKLFDYNDDVYNGIWVEENRSIYIKRQMLSNLGAYAETLFHECAHAASGADDGTRDLESQLGTYINKLVWRIYIERTLKTSEKSLKQEQ